MQARVYWAIQNLGNFPQKTIFNILIKGELFPKTSFMNLSINFIEIGNRKQKYPLWPPLIDTPKNSDEEHEECLRFIFWPTIQKGQ